MSNITNSSPIVTEQKLTEFYNDIKPFLGCPAYVTQEGDEMYFSAEEKVIGRWLDGKPLYQKTITTTIPTSGNTVKQVELTDGLNVYNIQAIIVTPGGASFINEYVDSANGLTLIWNRNDNNSKYIAIRNQNASRNGDTTYITIQYTKASDSAVTTVEQKPTHYSTDEQVVGTWIDGKPIYQKTFELNYVCPSKNGWEVVQNNAIHNIDMLISATTSYIYASSYRYTNATTVRVDEPSGNLTIYVTGDQMSGNTLKQITIQYTKATD